MKTRQGFVSNSSSTSFCIYGAEFQEYDIKELFGEEWYEELQKICNTFDLEYYDMEYESVYVGRSWSSIDDNQTGKEFKDGVELSIIHAFPSLKIKNISTYEEAWYNG